MKHTKNPAKRARVATTAHKKRPRPLHKRVLLHPFSVMVILCAGVLIAGSTLHGRAVSYDVTATVPATVPSAPAVIAHPTNALHFTAQSAAVTGTCPPLTYVKLYRNTAFSGVSQCDTNTQSFQIQTSLAAGVNELQARVYNVTDQEGPVSPPVTVYYDETILPQPTAPAAKPVGIGVSNLDRNIYQEGQIRQISAVPTITGVAPPFSDITVTFHSVVSTCLTKADANGNWSCTLAGVLADGIHHVDIKAHTPDGTWVTFPTFQVRVVPSLPNVTKIAPSDPFTITAEYQYLARQAGQSISFTLGVAGGSAPYMFVVDWGDGTTLRLGRNDRSPLTISHVYTTAGKYIVAVDGKDAAGAAALLQMSTVIREPVGLAVATTSGSGKLSSTISSVRNWLWIVWPVYIAVVLMAISYWIGEQEAYQRMIARRRAAHGTAGKGKR